MLPRNGRAPIIDDDGNVLRYINNYEHVSFDFVQHFFGGRSATSRDFSFWLRLIRKACFP